MADRVAVTIWHEGVYRNTRSEYLRLAPLVGRFPLLAQPRGAGVLDYVGPAAVCVLQVLMRRPDMLVVRACCAVGMAGPRPGGAGGMCEPSVTPPQTILPAVPGGRGRA